MVDGGWWIVLRSLLSVSFSLRRGSANGLNIFALFLHRQRLKSWLMSQSPPSRTRSSVREGGLCIVSPDFNRRRFINEARSHCIEILNPLAVAERLPCNSLSVRRNSPYLADKILKRTDSPSLSGLLLRDTNFSPGFSPDRIWTLPSIC
jgi:hypothetical protein